MLFVGINNFLADWHSFNSGELLSMALDYDNWLVANSYGPPYPSINNLTDVQNLVATQNLSTFCTYLAQASTYHSTIGTLLNNIQQSDFIQQLGQLATLMTNIVQVQFTQSEILTSLSHAGKATMWNHIITQAANNQGLLAHYRTNNTQEFVKQCIIVLPSYVDSYITETVSQYLQKIRSYYNTEQYNSLINALTELYYTPSQTMQLAEWHVYGSSRLGIYKVSKPLAKTINETIVAIQYQTRIKYRYNGNKQYELSNHLGNVLVTISDRRKAICNNQDSTLSYSAVVVTATDYYAFGSPLIGRTYEGDTANKYRYSFNGKEMDREGLGGGQSTYDYGFRIYNPALGRFLSVDPLTSSYPWYTPYQFAGNTPICAIDLDGLEMVINITGKYWINEIELEMGSDNANIEKVIAIAYDATTKTLSDLPNKKARKYAESKGGWINGKPASLNFNENKAEIVINYKLTDGTIVKHVFSKEIQQGKVVKETKKESSSYWEDFTEWLGNIFRDQTPHPEGETSKILTHGIRWTTSEKGPGANGNTSERRGEGISENIDNLLSLVKGGKEMSEKIEKFIKYLDKAKKIFQAAEKLFEVKKFSKKKTPIDDTTQYKTDTVRDKNTKGWGVRRQKK